MLPLSEWYLSSIANLLPAINDSTSLRKVQSINSEYNQRFMTQGECIPIQTDLQQGYRVFFVGSKTQKLKKLEPFRPRPDLVQAERYVDAMVAGLMQTKHYKNLERDIAWYKKEHYRLIKDNKELLDKNRSLTQSVQKMTGGKIVDRARSLERRIYGRSNR